MQYIGNTEITAKFVGNTEVQKQYLGDTLVWEKPSVETWVDLGTIDNTIPFDAIGWVTGYTLQSGDRWTAEKSGITSDNMSWTAGFNEQQGWFSQHRWGPVSYGNKYSCDFKNRESYAPDLGARADLPTKTIEFSGNTYTINVLEYKDFENWKPCYGAYSNPSNKYGSGQVFVRLIN